ncbi:MAG TPA: hypothetical protein PKI62_14555 [bacterium]|nr:hypothetical protein [bacterium]HPR89352.1 hypothetical protein [bacterium]
MKRFFSSLVAALLLCAGLASARPSGNGGFGVGLIVGAPTGLSIKSWLGPHRAIDAAAAWTTSGHDNSLYLHADMLIQRPNALHLDTAWLDWHYGLGVAMSFKDETETRLRIPIGLDYSLTSIPLEFFGEIVPAVLLTPDSGFDIDGGIGVRLFF